MTDANRMVEFVLAQIADDEAAARAAADYGDRWSVDYRAHNPCYIESEVGSITSGLARDHADHIARQDPARVLAECAAKKAIVEEFTNARDWARDPDCPEQSRDTYQRHAGSVLDVLRLLAQPYADRPGWDPAWEVET